jgi:hypothetical protein
MKVTQAQYDEMARVGTVNDLEVVDAVPAPAAVASVAAPEPVVEAPADFDTATMTVSVTETTAAPAVEPTATV